MKIEEQVLSREQMAHLVELGVDTSDASMAYYNISRENEPDKWLLGIANTTIGTTMLVNGFEKMQPTYTIGDLIEKLPKELPYGNFVSVGFNLYGHVGINDDGMIEESFNLTYHSYGYPTKKLYTKEMPNGDDCNTKTIDKLYYALCWVAENHKELIK